ncbi:MAG: protoglobin domain-containing protein [Gemmatimonadaceae bacterium]
MKNPVEVAGALGITPEMVQARLEAIGLDAAAFAHLRTAAHAAAGTADAFLDALYARLLEYPETAALLSTEEQVQRLKAHQHHYLRELFELDVDWAYVLRRLWIGVVHHRVRLLPQWYLTTYSHFVCDHLDPIVRSAESRAEARAQALAMIKKIFFDASLALDSYGRNEESAQWTAARGLAESSDAAAGLPHTVLSSERRPSPATTSGYSRIRLTSENTLERRRFIGLTDDDIATLRSLQPLVARHTTRILDEFYAFHAHSMETRVLVPPPMVDRLKHQVGAYWMELCDGTFDRPYAASRMRIGVIHEKVGLQLQWYMAGLARQTDGFLRAIAEELPDPVPAMRALVRAVFFDLSFIIDAYMESRADSLLRADGYAAQLVAGLASAVAVLDASDRLISANRTLVSVVAGDPAVLYLMPVDRAIPIPEVSALVARVRAGDGMRLAGFGALGGRRYRITAMSLAGAEGVAGSVAVVLDDVTELVRIGGEIDRQADHFEQLADAVGSVLWEVESASWTIVAINRAAVTLTGYRDVHFLGRPLAWIERIVEDDRESFMRHANALAAGEQCEVEYRLRHADGREIWVRSRMARAREAGEARLIASTTDITATRRAEALRLEAIAKMAGGVAHIVNNSLTGVLGGIELHAHGTGGMERAPLLQEAVRSTQKAGRMAAQLLTFAGRQMLKPLPLSLSRECAAAMPLLQAMLGPSVRIVTSLEESLWPCRADRDMLVTSLECLAANARQAMGANGEFRITTRNVAGHTLPAADRGHGRDWVELEVSDTGEGMTEQVKQRAIEPFFTTRSIAESAELGLSMVYGFVTQSGGEVHIDSTPQVGTRVTLRLPRLGVSTTPETLSRRPAVLLVEDDPGIRRLTTAMITLLGYEVHETGLVEEARALALTVRPQVLVTDIVLGQGTDGVTLAAELARTDPSLSVILVSGYSESQFDMSALPEGFQFLAKPFSVGALQKCLTAVMSRG